jgi:GAF domain-containing protein
MSKQAKTDPLPHIVSLSAALRAPGQPGATFKALDAAMRAVIGHKLLTVLLYHADLQQTERFYASDLEAYPIGGRKEVRPTKWTEQLLIGQRCYIGYNAADIEQYFLDHALIHSLGCDAILNVPVVYDGVTLGTVNLLNEEGFYDEGDTEIAMTLANIAAPAYLQVAGRK